MLKVRADRNHEERLTGGQCERKHFDIMLS